MVDKKKTKTKEHAPLDLTVPVDYSVDTEAQPLANGIGPDPRDSVQKMMDASKDHVRTISEQLPDLGSKDAAEEEAQKSSYLDKVMQQHLDQTKRALLYGEKMPDLPPQIKALQEQVGVIAGGTDLATGQKSSFTLKLGGGVMDDEQEKRLKDMNGHGRQDPNNPTQNEILQDKKGFTPGAHLKLSF